MSEKPPAGRKSFKVSKGNRFLTVYPWKHPKTGKWIWRFGWKPTSEAGWNYVTRKTRELITGEAEKILHESADGVIFSALPVERRRWLETLHREVAPEDQAKVLEFIANLKKSAEIATAAARFRDLKVSKAGEETPYLQRLLAITDSMAEHFKGRAIVEVGLEELQLWLDTRCEDVEWKRKQDIRAALVQFWRWARKDGIGGNDIVTTAERLPEVASENYDQCIVTPAGLLRLGDEVELQFRAWLVLGCFSGMRPEEISPPPGNEKKKNKRGLRCEEIDWVFRCIRVPKCVAKGGKRARVIPFNDALEVGLAWAGIKPGMTGPICPLNPTKEGETARLGKIVFGGEWPKDVCRHSYGSYRNAQLRSLEAVAEEMGTSVGQLHSSYHNPRAEQEAVAYFGVRFGVPMCSDKTEAGVAEAVYLLTA